jgi:hypothetical protein
MKMVHGPVATSDLELVCGSNGASDIHLGILHCGFELEPLGKARRDR